MLAQPDISICAIAPPKGEQLGSLLASLDATADSVAVEAVILCNGSEPPYIADLDKRFPLARFITSRPGQPLVRAQNLCLRHAGGRYLSLWRPDITPLPGCLPALVAHLDDHPTTAIAAPVLLDPGGGELLPPPRLPSAFAFLWKFTGLAAAAETGARGERRRAGEPGWLGAEAMAVRREALLETGLFDERYHYFYHDADLCRRALAAGWHLAVAEPARAVLRRRRPAGAILDPLPEAAASPLPTSPVQLLDALRFLVHRALHRRPATANLTLAGMEEDRP
ncbi:MAG: glycosyltransferase [Thermodesulfobacteriota bacterium]